MLYKYPSVPMFMRFLPDFSPCYKCLKNVTATDPLTPVLAFRGASAHFLLRNTNLKNNSSL